MIPPTTILDETEDSSPWILPAKRHKKSTSTSNQKNKIPPPAIQIPKVIPSQVPDKDFPAAATGIGVYTFSIDCRIKAGLNESVNPSRLLQAPRIANNIPICRPKFSFD